MSADTPPANRWRPPRSGALVGFLVDLLDLRRAEPKTTPRVLSDSQARAYFSGVADDTRENLGLIAAHLGALNGEGELRVRRRLEWHWIVCDLRDALTEWTDARQSREIAGTFGEYTTRTIGYLQLLLPDSLTKALLSRGFLVNGTWPLTDPRAPGRPVHATADLLARLLAIEKHPVWRATLAHAGRDIPHGMHE